MKRLILIVVLLLAPALASADQVKVGWDPPTTMADGSAIDPQLLNQQAFYRFYVCTSTDNTTCTRAFQLPDGNWAWVNYPGTVLEGTHVQMNAGEYVTITFVIQKDPSLPINHKDATGAEDNKIASAYAVPFALYQPGTPPPPPPPPPTGAIPTAPPGNVTVTPVQ